MLLVTNLANTKWCRKPKKWQKPWHMGTYLRVLWKSYPMNTNMAGFRWFSNLFYSLCFRQKLLQHWLEVLKMVASKTLLEIMWIYYTLDSHSSKTDWLCLHLISSTISNNREKHLHSSSSLHSSSLISTASFNALKPFIMKYSINLSEANCCLELIVSISFIIITVVIFVTVVIILFHGLLWWPSGLRRCH